MKRLCFVLLLISGAHSHSKDYSDSECPPQTEQDGRNRARVFYNESGLTIAERSGSMSCSWVASQCYVDCASDNLTVTMTTEAEMINVEEKVLIAHKSLILVFKTSEQEIKCHVTGCVRDLISKLLMASSTSKAVKDLKKPRQMKKMCSNLFASDSLIKKAYIRAEKKYVDVLISSEFNETFKNFDLEEFNMTVFKMDMMPATDDGLVQVSAPKASDDDLAVDVFLPTKPFAKVSLEQVGIVTYSTGELFKHDPETVLKSKVIRVETVGHEMINLAQRLVIHFTMNRNETIITGNKSLACLFYNVDAAVGQEWNDLGSFTNLEHFNSSGTVTCSYDHMTPFAVLLVDMNMAQIEPQQWKVLSYITYIGCSISSLFSAVTIFLYVFAKKANRDTSIRIHVSLSAAVFLLNTSFLFIEWGASWSQEGVCVLIAAVIQYSLLACFSWNAIEALHLYLLLIKVFNVYTKRYMVKLSLFGWGVPAVIVGGSLCAYGSTPFYGITEIKLLDTNDTTKFCWITDARLLYGTNVTYFSLTFLFNMCILVTVSRQICKLRRLNVRGSKLPSRMDLCTILGLTVLLGTTWGLAFFTSGYTNYPVLYLFCICNTLQGLFICLWFNATLKKNRPSKAETTTASKPTTAKSYESSFTQ